MHINIYMCIYMHTHHMDKVAIRCGVHYISISSSLEMTYLNFLLFCNL